MKNKMKLTLNKEKHERKGFHASDVGKMAFDIYHEFMGTPETNPTEWFGSLKWGAGKGVELQMIKVLKDSGIVAQNFCQETEPTTEMERNGVKIRMKFDAIVSGGESLEIGSPIEVKSINNKNSFDIKKYAEGFPRESYVKQLAIYMDCLKKDTGYLMVASIDGLNHFEFACNKIGEGKYQCGEVQVDITKDYERFAKIWKNIQDKVEPDAFEFGRYKIPVAEIDWTKVSKTDISKARNGMKVIGDPESWHVSYSPYKSLLLKAQGVELGYTEAELAAIVLATKGYSAKVKLEE
jgi:hypothetical protein